MSPDSGQGVRYFLKTIDRYIGALNSPAPYFVLPLLFPVSTVVVWGDGEQTNEIVVAECCCST